MGAWGKLRTYDNPKSHMNGWPVSRRMDPMSYGLLEVFCPHGVGHPMRESVLHMEHFGPVGAKGSWDIHGCDGCCLRKRCNHLVTEHEDMGWTCPGLAKDTGASSPMED